jgi:ribose transport system permease protein
MSQTNEVLQSADSPVSKFRMSYKFKRELGIFLGLIVLIILFSLLSPYFLNMTNMMDIALQSSINAILAIGMTYVILTSGIDLSIGSAVALAGFIAADLMARGYGTFAGIAAGALIGIAAGLVNGFIISKMNLSPFIVTLGTMSIFRGLVLTYSQGKPVQSVPDEFKQFFAGYVGPIPTPVILALLVAVIAYILLHYTPFGYHLTAIGGNREAAVLSGINVTKTLIGVYIVSGIASALASMILVARIGAAEPTAGMMYELDAIAAAVMGGASLMGGVGSIVGTVIGALIMGTLRNGLTILNVSSFYQQMLIGIVIILAVYADQISRNKRR